MSEQTTIQQQQRHQKRTTLVSIGGHATAGRDIVWGDQIERRHDSRVPAGLRQLVELGEAHAKKAKKLKKKERKKRQERPSEEDPECTGPVAMTLAQAGVANLRANYLVAAVAVCGDICAVYGGSDHRLALDPTNTQRILDFFSCHLADTLLAMELSPDEHEKLMTRQRDVLAHVNQMDDAFVAFEQAYTEVYGTKPPPDQYCIEGSDQGKEPPSKRNSP